MASNIIPSGSRVRIKEYKSPYLNDHIRRMERQGKDFATVGVAAAGDTFLLLSDCPSEWTVIDGDHTGASIVEAADTSGEQQLLLVPDPSWLEVV